VNTDKVKISIIIVSYNEIEYLQDSIMSCLAQELPYKYEIIIGDDGSSDGSLELIEDYREKYPDIIKYFVMDRTDIVDLIASERVSNILKKALEISEGEYVTALSGDDILVDKSKLFKQVDFLDRNKAYASCYTDFMCFGKKQNDVEVKLRATLSNPVFWATQYMHISCFVVRREIKNILLDRFVDDTGMVYCMLNLGKSKHIKRVGFGYRQREKSIVHELDILESHIMNLMLYQDILNYGKMRASSLAKFCSHLEYVYNHRQEMKNERYYKYFRNCRMYGNDILLEMYNSLSSWKSDLKIKKMVFASKIIRSFFYLARKMEVVYLICFEKMEGE